MLTWIREKFGAVLISAIIVLIAAVFVFYGVFNPKATRGLHEGAVAGTVNGESISIAEFNQALNRQLEFYKSMMGGSTITEQQMKQFGIRTRVWEGLVNNRLLVQEAYKMGLEPSEAELREKIQQIDAFHRDGKFDMLTYKQRLEGSPYRTPATFERAMRDDLAAQSVQEFFKNRVQVSEKEIQKQFLLSENKRNIKFVLLTSESGRKGLQISPEEVKKFMSDSAKLNIAKGQFERKKDIEFKGKTFDDVKEKIVRDLLASEKLDEVKKLNEKLADQVVGLMTRDKASDAKVNALLKPYSVDVKSTGMISQLTTSLPAIGEATELLKDAFAAQSPIDPAQGGKAKKYSTGPWIVVALVSESQQPDLAKLPTERERVARELAGRKEREIFSEWLQKVRKTAKVEENAQVIGNVSEG